MNKITVSTIRQMKKKNQKIAMITAYDYPTAKAADISAIEIILVGDSLGMVVLGYEDTIYVTLEDMIHHTKAVARGCSNSLIVTDMPFLTYNVSIEDTLKNAAKLIQKGGAHCVKLEGGHDILPQIRALVSAGIPVMGHIGLTPQSVLSFGGYYTQGKTSEQAQSLISQAIALEEVGAFAIVLECIPAEIAELITNKVSIPTIGIGAGIFCDGQVLVLHDMIGLNPGHVPNFVKRYGHTFDDLCACITSYSFDVKKNEFPLYQHSSHVDRKTVETVINAIIEKTDEENEED